MESTESAAPTSTADIAASVIESAEQADTSSAETGESSSTRIDTTDTAVETPTRETAPTEAELSAAAKFLLQQGHTNKKLADGRDTRLPYGTVEKMLDRYLDQQKTTWQTERQAVEAQAKELREHLQQVRNSVAGDPKAFLSELAEIDPRYRVFLEPAPAAPAPAADDPMPPPDYDLGNGQRTYSLEGLQKRDAWVQRQLMRTLEAKVEERFKPIAEREQQAKARDEERQFTDALHARTHTQMQDAQTWPLFGALAADGSLTEFQTAVLGELQKDTAEAKAAGRAPALTLEGAYIRVSSKRFTEDDATKRARLLKEIAAAPTGSALSRQTADAPRAPGPRSTAEIARQTIAKLESAG